MKNIRTKRFPWQVEDWEAPIDNRWWLGIQVFKCLSLGIGVPVISLFIGQYSGGLGAFVFLVGFWLSLLVMDDGSHHLI